MPDRLHKRPRDPAQLAKLMIDIASGEVEDREPEPSNEGKDAAAVFFGPSRRPERREGESSFNVV